MADFQINDPVAWRSNATDKYGKIAAIVPAGKTPSLLGYHVDKEGTYRLEKSYVVRAKKPGTNREVYYWPTVTALRAVT